MDSELICTEALESTDEESETKPKARKRKFDEMSARLEEEGGMGPVEKENESPRPRQRMEAGRMDTESTTKDDKLSATKTSDRLDATKTPYELHATKTPDKLDGTKTPNTLDGTKMSALRERSSNLNALSERTDNLNALPEQAACASASASAGTVERRCAICERTVPETDLLPDREEAVSAPALVVGLCSHVMHFSCWDTWKKNDNTTCPTCKTDWIVERFNKSSMRQVPFFI